MARIKKILAVSALALSVILAAHGAVFAKGSVVNSPHNLSVSGGKGKHNIAYDEVRICVFCHTPHNAQPSDLTGGPLWNRAMSSGQYQMYQSDTFDAVVTARFPVPIGSSRVCLSCHDGTVALASYGGAKDYKGVVLKDGAVSGTSPYSMPAGPNLTTDLQDDHPISFLYTSEISSKAQVVDPNTLPPAVKLDNSGFMQCTACHDPHDNQYGNFLVMSNEQTPAGVTSPLCSTCHIPSGWDNTSPHYAGAGCLNCHASHSAAVKQYLLKAPVDQLCYSTPGCHNDTLPPQHQAAARSLALAVKAPVRLTPTAQAAVAPTSTDMKSVFSQSIYKHPVGQAGGYKANERLPLRRPRVDCVDCHNAHLAGSSTHMKTTIQKSLRNVKGISKDTMAAVEATTEYQICYKCHSGPYAYKFISMNKPNRVIGESDQMKRFDSANPSFHPVTAIRRGNGASLLAQYQGSMLTITCSDCHNSDQSKKAGGTGPNGPHGSRYEHILMAEYDMPVKGAAGRFSACSSYRSDYALCFTCHSEDYIMGSGTNFMNGTANEHTRHVVDRCVPCFACHDPHGVSTQAGATSMNNAHLINFDRGYAASQTLPNPRYTATGVARGNCTVSCHTGGTHSYAR
jgi:predicted CXXCH cytochrome family protein